MKLEVNKKNKEIHSMKVAFVKLDDENKKNIRILEEVIIEANRNKKKLETVKYTTEDMDGTFTLINNIENIFINPKNGIIYFNNSLEVNNYLININYNYISCIDSKRKPDIYIEGNIALHAKNYRFSNINEKDNKNENDNKNNKKDCENKIKKNTNKKEKEYKNSFNS